MLSNDFNAALRGSVFTSQPADLAGACLNRDGVQLSSDPEVGEEGTLLSYTLHLLVPRVEIAGTCSDPHIGTPYSNLDAVETCLFERVGDIGQLVLTVDF